MHIPARVACGIAALGLVVASVSVAGAPPKKTASAPKGFELTVDSIMRGPKLVGYPPTGLRWSGDSKWLYFEWRRPNDAEASTWVVGREGGDPRKLSDTERRSAPPVGGVWDTAHRRVLFVDDGDVVLVDSVAGSRRNITRTTGAEANPRWARHETAVTFTRENNLYLVPVDSGSLEQLTDITAKKRDPRETDSQKFIKAEEQNLIEHTKSEADKKKKAEDKEKAHALPKYELGERQSAADLELAPDGKHVFLIVLDRADSAKPAVVPNYVTQSGYTEDIPGRTKVGDAQDKRALVVMNLETGKSQQADAAFAGNGHAQADGKAPAREVRWGMPMPNEDGTIAVANVHAADNKDRWLVAVDPDSGKSRVIDTLHDDAWVREIGGFGPASESGLGWLPDQKHLWFLSERDGWMQLYTVDASSDRPTAKQLTQGKWEIEAAALSLDKKKFYLTTTEAHPGERHIYAMSTEGGERTKLTVDDRRERRRRRRPTTARSGSCTRTATSRRKCICMPNKAGAAAKQITTTPTDEWRSFKWVDPQLITYKTRDGVDVYARLYTPEMIGAKRDPTAPAVVFVHGAGYAQNAHKYWASYYREYMFHNLLASRGYVVLDPDYRASSGYGRDWRTAIYRHMGGKDLDDVVDGAKYLVTTQQVNAKRIGVYGGSYGGFITLMAMFTSPDTFAAGAALRPVTDWAHYNHGYTSNILNDPQDDAEAYRKSSPIYFADGLKGALLICHGMVDTNVFFQDTVRLVQRLIELRKENWSVAPFPVENHGFEEETSWADEYKRILKLFDDNLQAEGEC